MKIVEILNSFLFRLKWFVKDDIVKILSWAGIYILGGAIIAWFATREFLEKRKKKGGVRDDYII